MFLSLLLLFLEILDGIEIKNGTIKGSNFEEKVHQKSISHPANDSNSFNGEKSPLVPLEFPDGFYENGGKDVLTAIQKKMENFFGKSMADEMMKINTSDGVLDYLSKADFQSSWVNTIVNNLAEKLKPKEGIPLESINSRKKCRKACFKRQSGVTKYLNNSYQRVISSMTDEDFRFELTQDPSKSFTFIRNPEFNKYECKCKDDGYVVKVSPRVSELIQKKYFENEDGVNLADQILNDAPHTNLSSIRDVVSWQTAKRLTLYLVGWKNKASRGYDGDFGEWILFHGMILALLFVFCHCFFYFYLIYVILDFFANFVF